MTGTAIVAAVGVSTVETIGAYAGYAAILGLGVMSLLYFTQAREVKRLREWAGRAPERAAELEQRVQADAQRRVVATPMAPATTAAQTDAARQAAAAAELYAKIPAPPPPPAPLAGPPGQLARPAVPAVPAAGAPTPAPGSVPNAPTPAPGSVPNAPLTASTPAPAPATAAVPAATTPADAAAGTGGATAKPSPTPNPAPMPTPAPSTPAATAAAAARQSVVGSRAASPLAASNGSGGQDTHESDAARPFPPLTPPPRPPETPRYDRDDDGHSRSRVGAIIGGGVLVVLVGVVLMVSLTGDDPKPKPNDFGTSTLAATPDGTGAGASTTASAATRTARVDRKAVKVAVLNGTTQTGLAREVADRLEKGGFTIPTVGNNPDNQQVPQTIVSYRVGNERAARTVAELIKLDASSVQSIDTNTSVAADADVVVTVGTDQIG